MLDYWRPACFNPREEGKAPDLEPHFVKETIFVLTEGADQGSEVTTTAIKTILEHLISVGKIILGKDGNMKHLLDTSDGCGCQFKCAQALILRAVVVSPEGPLKGLVKHQSLKHESAHGKDIPDVEGGNAKRKLSKVIRVQCLDLFSAKSQVIFTASQLVAYAQDHLKIPTRLMEASAAHRARAVIQERTFLELPAVAPRTVAPPEANSIRSQHRIAYSSSTSSPESIRWSVKSCGCDSCCVSEFDACTRKSMVPPLTPVLFGGRSNLLRQQVFDSVQSKAPALLAQIREGKRASTAANACIITLPEVRMVLRRLKLTEPPKRVDEADLLKYALGELSKPRVAVSMEGQPRRPAEGGRQQQGMLATTTRSGRQPQPPKWRDKE